MRRAPNKLACLLWALLMLSPTLVQAVSPARDQPITIEADGATIDEKKGVSIYSGHVVLKQGDIQITADKLIVHHQQGKVTHVTAEGKPVHYRQQGKRQQGKTTAEDIEGEAKTMEYFAEDERLLLLEGAKLSQGGNAFSGNRIDYDIKGDVVTAGVSQSGRERVQVTIQPKSINTGKDDDGSESDADSP